MSTENLPWNARQWQSDKYTFNWCVEDCKREDVVSACTKEQALVLAASPELLEACELLLSHLNEREPFTDAGMWEHKLKRRKAEEKARAAIAKAKGEQ